jgi:hypothetical protein
MKDKVCLSSKLPAVNGLLDTLYSGQFALWTRRRSCHTGKQTKPIFRNFPQTIASSLLPIACLRLLRRMRSLVLDQGEIVEQGKHSDLLAQNGLYAAMWQRQQEKMGSASLFEEPSV